MTNDQIMTPEHPDWEKFCELLSGSEGCDFKEDPVKGSTWKCKGGDNKDLSKAILKKYFPEINIRQTMVYFEEHGGYCDCEILFNVDP